MMLIAQGNVGLPEEWIRTRTSHGKVLIDQQVLFHNIFLIFSEQTTTKTLHFAADVWFQRLNEDTQRLSFRYRST